MQGDRSSPAELVHKTGIHGGPDPRIVGAIAMIAGLFGSTVLLLELLG